MGRVETYFEDKIINCFKVTWTWVDDENCELGKGWGDYTMLN